jgi:N-acyl homoserine lactone hydrolase
VVRIDDLCRLEFGYFIRPAEETPRNIARVEPCLGYALRHPDGLLVFDTGIGEGDADVDAHYRPVRRPLSDSLAAAGMLVDDTRFIVNCHLHVDHCGGNPLLPHRPIFVQSTELQAAREPDYTIPALIDFPGARYEALAGEAEILPGVWVIPTPGHTAGHQSLGIRCQDGTIVLAGQAHDMAADYGADQLAWRVSAEARDPTLPPYPGWIERLQELDPKRVLFAHDQSVWEPV